MYKCLKNWYYDCYGYINWKLDIINVFKFEDNEFKFINSFVDIRIIIFVNIFIF